MTTLQTFKPIGSALLLSGLVIFSSCKKDDENVDPRDAYVGEYEMDLACTGLDRDDNIEIEKDNSDPKKLIIDNEYFEIFNIDKLEAEISGDGFEIEPTEFSVERQDGGMIEGEISGSGKFQGKELVIEFEFEGDINDSCELSGEKE